MYEDPPCVQGHTSEHRYRSSSRRVVWCRGGVAVWWCDHVTPAFPTQQYNTVCRSLRSRSHSLPPSHASLSVWRTARGPRYYQTWEMVLSAAAVTAGCLPARRPTVCPTNHRVSIHPPSLSAGVSLARVSLHWLGILVSMLARLTLC